MENYGLPGKQTEEEIRVYQSGLNQFFTLKLIGVQENIFLFIIKMIEYKIIMNFLEQIV